MAQIKLEARLKRLGRKLGQGALSLVQVALKTNHNRVVGCGVLVLLCFLPTWLNALWHSTLKGASTPILNAGFLYLGADTFWKQRRALTAETPPDEERIMGYLLILGCAACFPFFLSSSSIQALLCMMILLGIAVCNWGLLSVQKHALATVLVLISVYPSLDFLGNTLRITLTGNHLERLMAWLGGNALSAFGQPVFIQETIISLSTSLDPNRAVEVGSGCSGFDMAFPIAGFGLLMGLYLKQSWQKTLGLMAIGVALALAFNVPRIMLLAIAVVYWGKDSFEFWHGPIGGQIFATILFTLYYYAVMGIINWKPKRASS